MAHQDLDRLIYIAGLFDFSEMTSIVAEQRQNIKDPRCS
jgi:hypothetical protein